MIAGVTLWGVSDDATWLDAWPTIRNAYRLLCDDQHRPKAALTALVSR